MTASYLFSILIPFVTLGLPLLVFIVLTWYLTLREPGKRVTRLKKSLPKYISMIIVMVLLNVNEHIIKNPAQIFVTNKSLNYQSKELKKQNYVYGELGLLLKCKDSKVFVTRQKTAVGKLGRRRVSYEEGSVGYRKITSMISQTKVRFAKYKNQKLLCGVTDGLPHLLVDGRLGHTGEFIAPGILFLFITGYIGWVGRRFLQHTDDYEHSFEIKKYTAEIVLDVPTIFAIITESFAWPYQTWVELVDGELLIPNENFS